MVKPAGQSDDNNEKAVGITADASDTGYDIIQELIRARKSLKLTQKDLSAVTGVTQADISRIESGSRNPSLKLVRRLAKGVGMELKLVPLGEMDEESGKAQV